VLCTAVNHCAANEYIALLDTRQYAKVAQAIAGKLQTEPNNADALIASVDLILLQADVAKYDVAITLAKQCIRSHPQNGACHEALGNGLSVSAEQNGLMEGISSLGTIRSSFEKAIELDPNNVNAKVSLMTFYLEVPGLLGGSRKKAKTLLQQTSKTNADVARLLQAKRHISDDDLVNASASLLAIAPTADTSGAITRQQRDIMQEIGLAFIQQSDFTAAESTFRWLINRHAEFAAAYLGLGRALLAQGKAHEALPLLEQSLRLEPSAAVHYRLGKTWQALGDSTKAKAAFDRALAFTPALSAQTRKDVLEQLKTLKPSAIAFTK
jgi:tetratricopeptide (TPR) repeat protein